MEHSSIIIRDALDRLVLLLNDTATTEIYTLSLHDALPIYDRDLGVRARDGLPRAVRGVRPGGRDRGRRSGRAGQGGARGADRKSTRLNSSHANTSYAVICLKIKKIGTLHV